MPSIKRIEREVAARMRTDADNACLERLARLFAANPNGAMYTGPHTTDTGRALSAGKVTRKSQQVRQRARGEVAPPLPPHLAVHPKRLTPTPRNPDCATRKVSGVDVLLAALTFTEMDFVMGVGLRKRKDASLRWSVHVGNRRVGYCADPVDGMTWVRAAQKRGLNAKLLNIG